MNSERFGTRSKAILDRLLLFGAALLVIGFGTAVFLAADAYHISATWVLLGWVSVGFFAAVGWDYRARFRSASFVAFFFAWLVLHLLVFVVVMTYLGWLYWLLALFVELFFFYATAYWLFGLHPPLRRDH